MSLQVNLLKKSERRFQGIVSMKVMVLGSASVLVGITILVFLLAGLSKVTLNSNLARARREWERLSPQVAVLRAAQTATAANNKTLSELESWPKDNHSFMYGILRAVQKNIPSQMELYHFSVSANRDNEDAPLICTLRISGTAKGELTAVETKRQLNADAELHAFCGEIKLGSSQRYSGETWAFALEGYRLPEAAGQ